MAQHTRAFIGERGLIKTFEKKRLDRSIVPNFLRWRFGGCHYCFTAHDMWAATTRPLIGSRSHSNRTDLGSFKRMHQLQPVCQNNFFNRVHSLTKNGFYRSQWKKKKKKEVPFAWSDYAQITTVNLRVQDTANLIYAVLYSLCMCTTRTVHIISGLNTARLSCFFTTQIHPWLKCLDLNWWDVYTHTQKHAWTIIKSWPYRRDVRPLRAAVKCVKCDGCRDRCFDLIFCSSRIWPVRGVGPPPPPLSAGSEMDPSGAIQELLQQPCQLGGRPIALPPQPRDGNLWSHSSEVPG